MVIKQITEKNYFLDSAIPIPTRPPKTRAAPPATAIPTIPSLANFFLIYSYNI